MVAYLPYGSKYMHVVASYRAIWSKVVLCAYIILHRFHMLAHFTKCFHIVSCDYTWLSMFTNICKWVWIVRYGYIWLHLTPHAWIWSHLNDYGCILLKIIK